MLGRGGVMAVLAMLLAGCASDRIGADYPAVAQRLGPPKPGQSRIVILSEKRIGIGAALADVTVDGSAIGTVKAGTYIYADRPAGRHQLVATQALFPGDTKSEISTQSGRTYFFVIRNSERASSVVGLTLVGGLAGALVASAATSGAKNPGPVDFIPLDEATARTTLAELQLAE
jgi:hypothetical protein